MKIFIVEDNQLYAETLKKRIAEHYSQCTVKTFTSGRTMLQHLQENPLAVIIDYVLPDINGLELLRTIKSQLPNTHVIIVSGQADITTAINLVKEGAYDYLPKESNTRECLINTLQKIMPTSKTVPAKSIVKTVEPKHASFNTTLKGSSKEMEQVLTLMQKAANTNINVTITGETGTGKELVAKGIHCNSARSSKPFIAVNVTSIPEGLIESELFGHEKGAFTGADNQRIGKFEQANGGTLFLDEIADLDLAVQTKLLRVLQERELLRVGGNTVIPVNVRLITATHKNLKELVSQNKFRQDLYFRLLGLPIHLPPLRERTGDIALLADYFMKAFCKENRLADLTFSNDALKELQQYQFPGNIRELKAVIELACVLTNGNKIEPEHLVLHHAVEINLGNMLNQEKTLEAYTNEIIEHFLKKYNQNVRLVAQKLGIGKSTIYRMLHQSGS